jgi:diacylglycerol kinase family enzyme
MTPERGFSAKTECLVIVDMYYAFIVNPVAGTGFALKTMEKLEGILNASSVQYRIFRTEKPGHATEIAADLAGDEEIIAVVSVGGDGTAGEIAAGLTDTGKPMGIIPAGTGNDFIKSAGIPNDPEMTQRLQKELQNTVELKMKTRLNKKIQNRKMKEIKRLRRNRGKRKKKKKYKKGKKKNEKEKKKKKKMKK